MSSTRKLLCSKPLLFGSNKTRNFDIYYYYFLERGGRESLSSLVTSPSLFIKEP
jgi:hypothetical protein